MSTFQGILIPSNLHTVQITQQKLHCYTCWTACTLRSMIKKITAIIALNISAALDTINHSIIALVVTMYFRCTTRIGPRTHSFCTVGGSSWWYHLGLRNPTPSIRWWHTAVFCIESCNYRHWHSSSQTMFTSSKKMVSREWFNVERRQIGSHAI